MLLFKAFCVVVVVFVAGIDGAPRHGNSSSSLSQVFNVQTQHLYMPGSINRDEEASIGKTRNDRIDQIYDISNRIESFQKHNISLTLGKLVKGISQREHSLSNVDGKVTEVLNYLDHLNNTRPDSHMQELVMTMRSLLEKLINLQEDANNKSESFDKELNNIRGMLREVESRLHLLKIKSKDCEEINQLGFNKSDVYLIQPKGALRSYAVFCEMTPDRVWTVIFRRADSSVNFDRAHLDYVNGFGEASGNYWLGLEAMHLLTQQLSYNLRVDITRWGTSTNLYAAYSSFKIGDSSSDYMLTLSGEQGTATKGKLIYNSGKRFSAKDKDVDGKSDGSCVSSEGGAWWHGHCSYTVLTESWTGQCSGTRSRCMRWDYNVPLSHAVMKISRG